MLCVYAIHYLLLNINIKYNATLHCIFGFWFGWDFGIGIDGNGSHFADPDFQSSFYLTLPITNFDYDQRLSLVGEGD
jgi:hypothetical protein